MASGLFSIYDTVSETVKEFSLACAFVVEGLFAVVIFKSYSINMIYLVGVKTMSL